MRRFAVKRRIPLHQLIIASFLGVIGGVYIWKPVFEQSKITVNQQTNIDPNTSSSVEVDSSASESKN